jgi:hypothetical protein
MMALSDRVYRALQTAAERVAANEYAAGLAAHTRAGRKRGTYRHNPSEVHRHLVALMGSHAATDEEAMAYLHTYDCLKARLGATATAAETKQ